MNNQQTENSFFKNKVRLRSSHLPVKGPISVLDCFSADGKIWKEVARITGREIKTLRIEMRDGMKGVYLKGDNKKYLESISLARFDIIDLDSYGVPYPQLKILFKRKFQGLIFATFIQSVLGMLPYEMLSTIGYSKRMVIKCPTLFSRNGLEKFLQYLAANGIKKVHIITHKRKHYLFFSTH